MQQAIQLDDLQRLYTEGAAAKGSIPGSALPMQFPSGDGSSSGCSCQNDGSFFSGFTAMPYWQQSFYGFATLVLLILLIKSLIK